MSISALLVSNGLFAHTYGESMCINDHTCQEFLKKESHAKPLDAYRYVLINMLDIDDMQRPSGAGCLSTSTVFCPKKGIHRRGTAGSAEKTQETLRRSSSEWLRGGEVQRGNYNNFSLAKTSLGKFINIEIYSLFQQRFCMK